MTMTLLLSFIMCLWMLPGFTQGVSCTNCACVYIHTNDNDLITLNPYVFVDVVWIYSVGKL